MPEHPRDVKATLRAIAGLLRDVQHLGPEGQRTLAELVEELSRALETGEIPSAEMSQLTETTAHLVEELRQRKKSGSLPTLRDRLEQAALALETQHPVISGLTLRLVETLSTLGI